jgi:hypothetical protein
VGRHSAWGAETDGGAGERACRLQAQRTEAEAEVEALQRQQAALRILNTILRCANGDDPRTLLITQGSSRPWTLTRRATHLQAQWPLSWSSRVQKKGGRSARLRMQQKVHTTKGASEHGTSSLQHG